MPCETTFVLRKMGEIGRKWGVFVRIVNSRHTPCFKGKVCKLCEPNDLPRTAPKLEG